MAQTERIRMLKTTVANPTGGVGGPQTYEEGQMYDVPPNLARLLKRGKRALVATKVKNEYVFEDEAPEAAPAAPEPPQPAPEPEPEPSPVEAEEGSGDDTDSSEDEPSTKSPDPADGDGRIAIAIPNDQVPEPEKPKKKAARKPRSFKAEDK